MDELKPTPFQQRVLAIPETFDLALLGGRGGGKSFALALLILRHAEQHREGARILYLRKSYKGIADFESLLREIFGAIYGTAARYNTQEHLWRLPTGSYLELGQLESEADYVKYQGRSFNLIIVDEAGQYSEPDLLDRLRSNLRAPSGIQPRFILAANPGGVGHAWISKRYVFKASPWEPFEEPQSGRMFVHAPSTYRDNTGIDQGEYLKNLKASCPFDPELLRAWTDGDWSIARGAFFASCLGDHNLIEPWAKIPDVSTGYFRNKSSRWGDPYISHDWGTSAPSVTLLMVESDGRNGPDGKFYPKGSILVLDEYATNQPGSLEKGMGYTVDILADRIKEMCASWEVLPQGVADDAVFSKTGISRSDSVSVSIGNEFRRHGVYFTEAKKGSRVAGWDRLRRLMADAGKLDVPGLYIARNCEYLWATLPYLARDPRKSDDVDTRGPDHGADCLRYGCLRQKRTTTVSHVSSI
ncbi:terminase family protein [Desulfonatronum parangueonense]